MRLLAIAMMALLACTPATETAAKLAYSVTGCGTQQEREFAKTRSAENVEYEIVDGTILLTHHLNYVCCAKIKLELETAENGMILKEINTGEMCRCICDYDIKAEIGPLDKGTYLLNIHGVEYQDMPGDKLWEQEITIT